MWDSMNTAMEQGWFLRLTGLRFRQDGETWCPQEEECAFLVPVFEIDGTRRVSIKPETLKINR